MGRIVLGTGDASIELSDDLSGLVERMIRESAPTVLERMQEATEQVKQNAVKRWPVGKRRRERSRDQFRTGVRINGSTLEAFLTNDADYVFYIRTSQKGVNGSPWTKLVRTPGRRLGRKLADELARELADLANGRS